MGWWIWRLMRHISVINLPIMHCRKMRSTGRLKTSLPCQNQNSTLRESYPNYLTFITTPKADKYSLWGLHLKKIIVIKEITSPDDNYKIRCPRLGHQIYFSYCLSESMGLPCFKIFDCWFEHFQVEEYLQKELGPEEWKRLLIRPEKTKAQSLIELIEQAKKSK